MVDAGHERHARRRVDGRRVRPTTDDFLFDAFYRRHSHRLREFLRRRVSASEIDDIVEETFVAAWRHFGKLSAEPARELGWLFVTARNQLLNHLRAAGRSRRLAARLGSVASSDEFTPPDRVARDDFITDEGLAAIFAELSDDDRFILTLVAWDDCTTDELAAVLGCGRSAAKTRLSRARARLKRRLEQDGWRQVDGGEPADERRD